MDKAELFGALPDGRMVTKYTIRNRFGEYAEFLDYGASLHALAMRDREGKTADVLLGAGRADELAHRSMEGVIIGRNANRIRDAHCLIEGKEYFFESAGQANFLHSGSGNYALKFFSAELLAPDSIRFTYEDPGEAGFEGNVHVEITYTLGDDHALDIHYLMVPDTTTILNPTNHAYFNLGGYTDVRQDILRLFSTWYAPRDSAGLPLGGKASVAGTPYDFRTPRKIFTRTEAEISDPKLKAVDDFYCIDGEGYRQAAELYCPSSGRIMETWTDFPALVLFVPGFCAREHAKNDASYPAFGAVCIECQYMADAFHCTGFERPVFHAGQALEKRTTYRFRTDRDLASQKR